MCSFSVTIRTHYIALSDFCQNPFETAVTMTSNRERLITAMIEVHYVVWILDAAISTGTVLRCDNRSMDFVSVGLPG